MSPHSATRGVIARSTVVLITGFTLPCAPEMARADIWGVSSPSLSGESPLTKGWWDNNGGSAYGITVSGSAMAPVHAMMMPPVDPGDELGRLVLFETFEAPGKIAFYDFDSQGIDAAVAAGCPNPGYLHEYFCSGYTVTQSGDALVVGGDWGRHVCGTDPRHFVPADPWASVLDASAHDLSIVTPMPGLARYYPTVLVEPDGGILVVGGDYWVDANGDSVVQTAERTNNDTWVRYRIAGDDAHYGTWSVAENKIERAIGDHYSESILDRVPLYPLLQVLPARPGTVPSALWWLGPYWRSGGSNGGDSASFYWEYGSSGYKLDPRHVLKRGDCSAALLRIDATQPDSCRILVVGGFDPDTSSLASTDVVEVWDRALPDSMRWLTNTEALPDGGRSDQDLVLLPDGNVVIVGGHDHHGPTPNWEFRNECILGYPDYGPSPTTYVDFEMADTLSTYRQHHSVTVLLPDGRVVAAGGDGESLTDTRSGKKTTYEVFYPPYLFVDSTGTPHLRSAAERPEILSVQEHGPSGSREVYYGSDFGLTVDFDPESTDFDVVLMRPCAPTHSDDMNQRSILCQSASAGSDSILVTAVDSTLAPPGPYMLFVLTKEDTDFPAGVPSVAKWIFLESGTPVGAGGNTVWSGTRNVLSDYVVGVTDTLTVESGATIKFQTDQGNVGVDGSRVEIIVNGLMRVQGTGVSFRAFSSASTDTMTWYGIRVGPTGRLVFEGSSSGCTLKNARSAIAWERSDFPDLEDFDDKVVFTSDRAHVSFARDVLVSSGATATIPAGWRIAFEGADLSQSGADPALVELTVAGQLTAAGSSGNEIRLERANPSGGKWYGVRFVDAPDMSLSALSYVDISDATFAVTVDSLAGSIEHCTFASDSADILIDHDTVIASGETWDLDDPNGTLVWVNELDPSVSTHTGRDPARVELEVQGTLDLVGGAVTFRCLNPDSLWYGIRAASASHVIADDDSLRHARAPLILEGATWGDLDSLFTNLRSDIAYDSCLVDLSLATDVTVSGALTIPAGWTIGFAGYDQDEGGVDPARPELIVSGTGELTLDGTSGSHVVLRSDDPDPHPGDWYGVRIAAADVSDGLVFPATYDGAVEIRDARGALALEGDLVADWPDFGTLGDEIVFANNVSQISTDSDVEITDAKTIPAGWTIGFTAGREEGSSASSSDGNRVELIVKGDGALTAEGTAANPIKLRSDSPMPLPDDWFGACFKLTGVERTGYGYLWCEDGGGCPTNKLKHVTISDALFGVAIDSLRAPTLDSLTFNNITNSRHIYLDSTDVVVSRDTDESGLWDYWTLRPGTKVWATNASTNDIAYGTDNEVDLIIWGGLLAPGPTTATGTAADSVVFRPVTITAENQSTAGQDWGGLMLRNEHPVSLKYADIGHAKTPVFVVSPWASMRIRNSRIHHFAETGLWVQNCKGGGTSLDSVAVENSAIVRGDGLHTGLGDTGVDVDASDNLTLSGNVVSLRGLDNGTGGIGVAIRHGSTFCQTGASPARTLLLEGNIILGPTPQSSAVYSGIKLDAACGTSLRNIDIIENDIEEWLYVGIEASQSSDVQVSCNRIEGNSRGVEISWTGSTPTPLRFKDNVIRALVTDPALHGVGTNHPGVTGIGTDTATRGDNRITARQAQTLLVSNSDTTATVDATYNFWFKNVDGDEAANDVALTDSASIAVKMGPRVDFANFQTTGSWGCEAPDTTLGGGGQAAVQPPALARGLDGPATGQPVLGIPLVRALGKPFPNPSRRVVDLSLAIPAQDVGRYTLEVFDVGGRRVFEHTWDITAGGYYRVGWGGRDGDGSVVGAGVYFLRVRGPAFHQLRKVVMIH